jgi:hypothetical protein
MKRTRRVSVEIEHREISIFLTLRESPADVRSPVPPDSAPIPAACPICGAPWVFVTPKVGGSQGSHLEQVSSVFQQLGLHPPLFVGGMFLICRQSFDQLKERL